VTKPNKCNFHLRYAKVSIEAALRYRIASSGAKTLKTNCAESTPVARVRIGEDHPHRRPDHAHFGTVE